MRPLSRLIRIRMLRFSSDRRGIAATEFALIAPALIFLVMGVLEMSMRFRASEEATRYVHQVADLISRENTLTTADLDKIYDASIYMMKPLDTTENLDLDISSVMFKTHAATPTIVWRRTAGAEVPFNAAEAANMGVEDETVIRIGIKYKYTSVLTNLFGGAHLDIVRSAFARPREERTIKIDGNSEDNGGTARTFGS
ncbi:MAG TPA: TadE/TadG family type IV pilus assembly protein [Hyphomonadaceae bacterium]|nr:TadE/TadG family type IV pilus assembly protein [Hyphomonadaceae bacterium]